MSRWHDMKLYIRFDAADEAALRSSYPVVRPHFERIVDEFYERILEHEGARRVLTGGLEQVERLKVSLIRWLESCFTGPWDDAYFHIHSRIGRVHVWIGLEPRYMITAMNLIRWGLQTITLETFAGDPKELRSRVRAIAKICDLELAIMLETYSDEYSAQLKRRERLAAIGQLGASISHEVKNPLQVIAASVFALKEHRQLQLDEKASKHIEKIERNVQQANQIVTTLLDFIRAKAASRQERDWNALVREAVDTVHLPAEVEVELRLDPEAGRAEVDAGQIARVLANLVQNGAEAMTEGGIVLVATRGDPQEVEVTVRDEGLGLPNDVLPQLFEPLFTTKPVGTGLGLALAKAIVEAHGGSIRAGNAPAPAKGAEFRVRLPRRAPREKPEDGVSW